MTLKVVEQRSFVACLRHSRKWLFPLLAFAPGFLSPSPAPLLQETILRMFLSVRLGEMMISVLMTSSSSPGEPEASLIPPGNIVKYLPY